MDDDQSRFGVVENIFDFSWREAIIERDQSGADEGRGEVGFEEDMTVIVENSRLTAWTQSPVFEETGQPEDPLGKLFIGEHPLMAANRFFLAIATDRFEQNFG